MRGNGQSFVGFWADEKFCEKLDEARGRRARSQFLRDALAEYLRRRGFKVEEGELLAPDRMGKGGPKIVYAPRPDEGVVLNEPANSKGPSAAEEIAFAHAGEAQRLAQESVRKRKAAAPSASKRGRARGAEPESK